MIAATGRITLLVYGLRSAPRVLGLKPIPNDLGHFVVHGGFSQWIGFRQDKRERRRWAGCHGGMVASSYACSAVFWRSRCESEIYPVAVGHRCDVNVVDGPIREARPRISITRLRVPRPAKTLAAGERIAPRCADTT